VEALEDSSLEAASVELTSLAMVLSMDVLVARSSFEEPLWWIDVEDGAHKLGAS
jgi:hypothetical protein